jgi:hypothetical protein
MLGAPDSGVPPLP